MAKTQKQPTFEQKLEELEQIIGGLEQGDMPLDRAIATYKRGVELTRELKTQLEGAREQLKVLNASDAADDKPASDLSDAE
ncbi:MAG TPA: exodeoxyribonuclease VII small subunit [Candidatus Fimadaptatus faecigallinarum]|uniref:Exodeoxyribonuclease 7 small subunit n=1 Tax=Candidatus Fimadaptatus faecigallinarum TaxID=2840814 RepID=A0A9D1LSB8_9FIRM|nr:exodeoxyribonuclease VII small subunit [Candidatus Fimadaptatus faecigallinarum]